MGILDERVAIITGAAQGIGAAYARGMAQEGASVVIADVLDKGPLAKEIRSDGGTGMARTTNVTDFASLTVLVETTLAEYGMPMCWSTTPRCSVISPIPPRGHRRG